MSLISDAHVFSQLLVKSYERCFPKDDQNKTEKSQEILEKVEDPSCYADIAYQFNRISTLYSSRAAKHFNVETSINNRINLEKGKMHTDLSVHLSQEAAHYDDMSNLNLYIHAYKGGHGNLKDLAKANFTNEGDRELFFNRCNKICAKTIIASKL